MPVIWTSRKRIVQFAMFNKKTDDDLNLFLFIVIFWRQVIELIAAQERTCWCQISKYIDFLLKPSLRECGLMRKATHLSQQAIPRQYRCFVPEILALKGPSVIVMLLLHMVKIEIDTAVKMHPYKRIWTLNKWTYACPWSAFFKWSWVLSQRCSVSWLHSTDCQNQSSASNCQSAICLQVLRYL